LDCDSAALEVDAFNDPDDFFLLRSAEAEALGDTASMGNVPGPGRAQPSEIVWVTSEDEMLLRYNLIVSPGESIATTEFEFVDSAESTACFESRQI
jgi:hypothetical protein